jgi:uncharacterized damage-inducible protein DinB
MEIKCRLKNLLIQVRKLSEGLLNDFHTPEQWVYQVDSTANHALWFSGHMGVGDNFFLSLVSPGNSRDMPGYNEMFGIGSKPTNDPSQYPPAEEVLEYMRERRESLLKSLDDLTDDDLSRPTPPGTPEMWPDLISVLETAIWHESLHAGQVSVARKALGNQPLLNPKPAGSTAS